ncbi:MAG: peptidase [Aeromicrobium sp.]|jgi:murein DD-endopeptidase MepM/ murein hydrolase activator NlpD|nr:peptidase [Aeromicrobium sp.]
MPSNAVRRSGKPQKAVAQRPGRRVAHREPVLWTKFRVSPAMIGAIALMIAGLGCFATAGAGAEVNSTGKFKAGAAASTPLTAKSYQAINDDVDVSRSFDRAALGRQVSMQAEQRARALAESDREITARASDLDQEQEQKRLNQWVLPVAGYRLTARFGQQSSLWSSGMHTGLDFAGPSGTKIVAVAAGAVTSAGYSGSYGNRTIITLADGTEIWYCHQSQIVVQVGDDVLPGQLTGYTGATGNVTGPHLHLEIRPPGSGPIDPEAALRAHGVNP